MPMPPLPIPIISSLIVIISLLPTLPALPVLPNPDPATIHQQQQPFHPTSSPPATIPSFPEQQSAVAGCPLHLPDELFPSVKHSCSPGKHGQLHKGRCCPVLATWLYSAYSDTALGKLKAKQTDPTTTKTTSSSSSYEMPLLPDDSETCVDGLEKSMRDKGIDLVRPNASCDVVYCFCGIRLHPLSCPQAFSFSEDGNLVADHRVKSLETDCLSNGGAGNNGFTSLSKCSKCLDSLYKLKSGESGRGNKTKSDGRTSKMRSRDCELMGLTWLLNKNRDAYLSTVTAVMRALMMNKPGYDPLSCSVSSDGMPLAVDSIQFDDDDDDQSSSVALHFPLHLFFFLMFLLLISSRLVLLLPNSF